MTSQGLGCKTHRLKSTGILNYSGLRIARNVAPDTMSRTIR